MKRILHLGIAWALSATLGAPAVADDAGLVPAFEASSDAVYDITMFRPLSTGEQMHVRGFGTQVQVVNPISETGVEPSRSSRIGIAFEADATVGEVDATGRPVRIAYTVGHCIMTVDSIETVIAPPGTVINAWLESGATTFSTNGQPLGPAATSALRIVASLENDGITEDDLLGSPIPRAIGESWTINQKAAATKFAGSIGHPLDENLLSGASTLVEATEQQGIPCLLVHSTLRADDGVPGIGNIPAGYEFQQGRMKMTLQRLLPEDTDLPALTDSGRMDVDFVLTSTGGSTGTPDLRYSLTRVVEMEMIPMSVANAGTETDDSTIATVTEESESTPND